MMSNHVVHDVLLVLACLFTAASLAVLVLEFLRLRRFRRRHRKPSAHLRLRVAVLTHYFPTSEEKWAGHTAYQTLKMLAKQCDVRVFYPASTYPPLLKPPGNHATIDAAWGPPGVPVTYVPCPAIPVLSRPLNGIIIAIRLLAHIRKFEPDVIFSYVAYPDGFAAVVIAKLLGIPTVIMAIGSDLNRIPDKLCERMTRYAVRETDYMSAVSHHLCATAIGMGADPRFTGANLNGSDISVFHHRDQGEARLRLGIPQNSDVVVYVGRLDLRKGLMELVAAISDLKERRPGLLCYIIGGGPDAQALTAEINARQMQQSIFLVPACPTEEVAWWMSASSLVTLPSYMEGCPNVVVEGLASGRPMVATHVGGIPELVNETDGELVPPRDVPALTRALDKVLSSEWQYAELAARHARSWEDVAETTRAFLLTSIERHRQRKRLATKD